MNTKAGAQQYELRLRQELIVHGTLERLLPRADAPTMPTFAQFAPEWLERYAAVNNSYSEQRSKRSALQTTLIPMLGQYRLDAINVRLVESVKAALLKEGVTAKTINNKLAVLSKCLKTARDWEIIESVPRIQFLRTQLPPFRYLSETECDTLISAADGVWRSLIVVALRTGMRFCELSALRWEDINLATGLVVVQRDLVEGRVSTTKSKRIRHLWLSSDALDELATLAPCKAGWVFQVRGGPPKHRSSIRTLQRICLGVGLPSIGWHTLRHTFASVLATKGVSLQVIKDLMGHSTMQMTLRYAHLSPSALRGALQLLDPAANNVGSPWAVTQNTPLVATCLTGRESRNMGQKTPVSDVS